MEKDIQKIQSLSVLFVIAKKSNNLNVCPWETKYINFYIATDGMVYQHEKEGNRFNVLL